MRVMVIIKATAESEAARMPSQEALAAMGAYNEELVEAGVMLDGEGLQPSMHGKRIAFEGDQTRVIDGPFAEAKELIAGFWMWQVKSMDEAVAWARRIPNVGGGQCVVELRPVFETEDFGEQMTPELREQEVRLRAELESKKRR